ncbi:MAG: gliding motility-associated C-terminal domain-containing protein [Bacteroidota bacterium]
MKLRSVFFRRADLCIVPICIFLIAPQTSFSQKTMNLQGWHSSDPMNTDYFIQNLGQFDDAAQSSQTVLYALNNADKIYFCKNSIVFRLEKSEMIINEKSDFKEDPFEEKDKKEKKRKREVYFVKMEWLGSNPNTFASSEFSGTAYYTFGKKGFENIRATGYKKITIKNLYPNIDIEYSVSPKGGIKYNLIMHPGANPDCIKMRYSGNVDSVTSDNDGNIIVQTPAGGITDHVPNAIFIENEIDIPISFSIKDNIVSFSLNTVSKVSKTIIIDPWITTPTSLTTDNAAYDIETDIYGNVYVGGGTFEFKIAKYNSSGLPLWTYTPTDPTWNYNSTYSKFCLLQHSGTLFIGDGAAWGLSGPSIMKIRSNGSLVSTSSPLVGNDEIWTMFYNACTAQLFAFGGGTIDGNNIRKVDTSFVSYTVQNFNGFCTIPGDYNDIASVEMDNNGDFYALISSYTCSYSNYLEKSSFSNSYNPPLVFNIQTGYSFFELNNYNIPGFNLPITVRANALASNNNYLFSYDGQKIIAWNKNTGSQLSFVIADPAYLGGQYRSHEGIAVDDCNNIYIGGTNKVFVYSFDGNTFTADTIYSDNITGPVYDISIDRLSGVLLVCGLGFVTTLIAESCIINQLNVAITNDCSGEISANVTGGLPPYTYYWSNGATTPSISAQPEQEYTVTVVDNSCVIMKGTATTQSCSLFIPNVFTPNSDDCNDVFYIKYDGNESYSLEIFNRWGRLMFSTTDKSNHWKGIGQNGKPAADGVYYYILNVGAKSYKGTVTLMR